MRQGYPVISEVWRGTVTTQTNQKTGGLLTSRSESEIMPTAAAAKIAAKLGMDYLEPRRSFRLNLTGKLRLQSGFRQRLRQSKALNKRQLMQLAKQLKLRIG